MRFQDYNNFDTHFGKLSNIIEAVVIEVLIFANFPVHTLRLSTCNCRFPFSPADVLHVGTSTHIGRETRSGSHVGSVCLEYRLLPGIHGG